MSPPGNLQHGEHSEKAPEKKSHKTIKGGRKKGSRRGLTPTSRGVSEEGAKE